MLVRLTIRNVVLIERLDIEFGAGLCALTGETGAGKSILLDAVGLALGKRAGTGLLRPGAERASVSAVFELESRHPARAWLADSGLDADADGALVLRRTLGQDGRSRAYVNDQPVTVGALSALGGLLVESYGQHDRLGLMDPTSHRAALDRFGGLAGKVDACTAAYLAWQAAAERLRDAEQTQAADFGARDDLSHDLDEIDALAPEAGEEPRLAEERAYLMAAENIAEALSGAAQAVTGAQPVDQALRTAHRMISDMAAQSGGKLDELAAAFDRAAIETTEAVAMLDTAGSDLEAAPGRLDAVEARLFALRAAARKHRVSVDELGAVRDTLAARLAAILDGESALDALRAALAKTEADYDAAATALSAARNKAATKLDKAVAKQLAPLKLGNAVFETRLDRLPESQHGALGIDRVRFEVITNPGSPAGDLHAIASGGELSRFMLALCVALAERDGSSTLIFDEIDAGIGGATAHAVGERLEKLAGQTQVLAVTHQPQVAALASHHFRVSKGRAGKSAAKTATTVNLLDQTERREEIARMLAGKVITDQARAAADRLLEARRAPPAAA